MFVGWVRWLGDGGHTYMYIHICISIIPCVIYWFRGWLHVTTSCQSAIFIHGSQGGGSALSWCRHAFYK